MKFYYFGGTFNENDTLEDTSTLDAHHFDGVMFTYDSTQGDMFVRVARDIKLNEKIKYLIAIRPYTISPQYLYAINQSIAEVQKDRLQINIIPGYIKDHESHVGGIVGEVNDSSSSVDRSNYTIKFIESLDEISKNKSTEEQLDVYISTTNNYVFDAVKKYNNKIILPYSIYKRGFWSDWLKDPSLKINFERDAIEIMLAMTPVIRETKEELEALAQHAMKPVWKKGDVAKVVEDVEYFTHESFDEFIQMLEEDNINHLLINAVPRSESTKIVSFIKQYVESRPDFVSHKAGKKTNILGGKK
jgi:hypothetical protein